jgi:hypothetical protein
VWNLCDEKSPKDIPKEVSYYYLCNKFKCLPGDGGLLDQDPTLLEAFILCMNTEHQFDRFKKEREKKAKDKKKK